MWIMIYAMPEVRVTNSRTHSLARDTKGQQLVKIRCHFHQTVDLRQNY